MNLVELKKTLKFAIESPALHTGSQEQRNFVVIIDTKNSVITIREDEMLVCLASEFQIPVTATCIGIFGTCQTMKAFLPDYRIELNIGVYV